MKPRVADFVQPCARTKREATAAAKVLEGSEGANMNEGGDERASERVEGGATMAGWMAGWLCMFAASTKANHDAADDDRTKDILSILASRGIHHTARSLAHSLG